MSQKIKCLLSVALFATYPTLAKYVLESNNPAVVTFLAEILSAAVLFFVFGIFPEWKKCLSLRRRHEFVPLLLMGLLAGVAGPLFMLVGLVYSTVLNGVLMLSLQTPFVMVLSYIFLKEKYRVAHLVSLILIVLGLIVYTTLAFTLVPRFTLNDLWFVGSAAAFAASNILYKRRLSHISHELVLISRNLLGGVFIFLGLVIASFYSVVEVSFDYASLASVGLIVLVPILIAQALWYSSLEHIKSIEASFFDALYPVFAALIAFGFLGEAMGWEEAFGAAIMVLGLMVSEWTGSSVFSRHHRQLQSFKQH